jgi:hypothetical protein
MPSTWRTFCRKEKLSFILKQKTAEFIHIFVYLKPRHKISKIKNIIELQEKLCRPSLLIFAIKLCLTQQCNYKPRKPTTDNSLNLSFTNRVQYSFSQAEVEKREGFRLGKVTESVFKKKHGVRETMPELTRYIGLSHSQLHSQLSTPTTKGKTVE